MRDREYICVCVCAHTKHDKAKREKDGRIYISHSLRRTTREQVRFRYTILLKT